MNKKRIVFMGTASFSLAILKMLFEEDYNVVGVVSQPDRYVGRKKILTMPDVKIEACLLYTSKPYCRYCIIICGNPAWKCNDDYC